MFVEMVPSQILSNITKVNVSLLRKNNVFLKRYILPQIRCNIRNKQSMTSEDDSNDQPIKYSTSKAASMRINEYRDPHGDSIPWYQPYIVSLSLTVFLIYFCILREENDIDTMLDMDLETTLKQAERITQNKAANNV
ncbi:uncharacterized protein LOC109860131 [Pseudomyrmex gracilis]|uniref:uncharacterized protein LOC109860131 n=1 Tax=Pseudomyrmex gracilis TaxID=219809 RepID=UPI000994DA03|nr:uncharacterized protein LOC109860131 [Pseudomyrmex gracilis]